VSVTFNPPRADGVVTAGFGGSGDCGGVYDQGDASMFSDPRTKAEILLERPELSTP
jgi:hypothetical protein